MSTAPRGVKAVTVVLSGEQTSGQVGLVDETLTREFDGPPLHLHPEFDELFFVVSGELTFQVEDEVRVLGPGEAFLARRGVPHTFANHSAAAARALIAVTPAGFERYFMLVSAALAGVEPPPEALLPRPATEQVGPQIPRG